MRELRKPRHATSSALLELRKRMGKTQQTFAVEVLPLAISTIARWETITPPEGEVLDRLAAIAIREGHEDLANVFLKYRIEEVRKKWLETTEQFPTVIALPRTDEEQEHAYIFMRVDGALAILLAQYFPTIAEGLNSKDDRILKLALEVLAATQKGGDAINGNPVAAKLMRAVADVMANPATQNSPITTTTKPQKGSKKK